MKPVLIVDKDGSLQVLKTIRGRKKSLKALIEYAQENIADPSRQIMGICHGEIPDSLQYTKDLLLQAVSPKELVESHHRLCHRCTHRTRHHRHRVLRCDG